MENIEVGPGIGKKIWIRMIIRGTNEETYEGLGVFCGPGEVL